MMGAAVKRGSREMDFGSAEVFGAPSLVPGPVPKIVGPGMVPELVPDVVGLLQASPELVPELFPFFQIFALMPLASFGFVSLVDWLTLSCVSTTSDTFFGRGDLWQAACSISAFKLAAHQGANDISQLTDLALRTIASKMLRVAQQRSHIEVMLARKFPALSPLQLTKHASCWVLQDESQDFRKRLLGAKLWQSCPLVCALLPERWPTSINMCLHGSAVVELGCGLGLFGVAVAVHGRVSRVLLTDWEEDCLRLARVTASLNEPLSVPVETEILRFGEPVGRLRGSFDVVIASDVAYSLDLVAPIWKSVDALLPKGSGRFICSHLDRTPSSTARLMKLAAKHGFELKHQHDLQPERQRSVPAWLFVFVRGGNPVTPGEASRRSFETMD